MIAGIVVGGGGAALLVEAGKKTSQATDETHAALCQNNDGTPLGGGCDSTTEANKSKFTQFDKQGKNWEKYSYVAVGLIGVGAGLAVTGLIKGFVVGGNKEKLAVGKRKHGPTDLVIAPVVTPQTSGATLLFRW